MAKTVEVEHKWHLVDANGEVLGRLAVKIANIIRGRHKACYTPNVDTGDFVVVVNAEKIVVTGKKETGKKYVSYSGFKGNQKIRSLADIRAKNSPFIIRQAVKGMLPKNRLAAQMLAKLKIYAGSEHPHAAQNPLPFGI